MKVVKGKLTRHVACFATAVTLLVTAKAFASGAMAF